MALPLFEELNRLRTMYLARRDPSELKVGRDLAVCIMHRDQELGRCLYLNIDGLQTPTLHLSKLAINEKVARLTREQSQPDPEELARYHVKVRDFAYLNHTSVSPPSTKKWRV